MNPERPLGTVYRSRRRHYWYLVFAAGFGLLAVAQTAVAILVRRPPYLAIAALWLCIASGCVWRHTRQPRRRR